MTSAQEFRLEVKLAACSLLSVVSDSLKALLRHREVSKYQFDLDSLGIASGVNRPFRVRYVLCGKCAHDMKQCVRLAIRRDVHQRPRGRCSSDVRERDRRRYMLLWLVELGQAVETSIRDGRHAHLSLGPTQLAGRRARSPAGEQLEEGCLSRRRKSYESCA